MGLISKSLEGIGFVLYAAKCNIADSLKTPEQKRAEKEASDAYWAEYKLRQSMEQSKREEREELSLKQAEIEKSREQIRETDRQDLLRKMEVLNKKVELVKRDEIREKEEEKKEFARIMEKTFGNNYKDLPWIKEMAIKKGISL